MYFIFRYLFFIF